nr:MAG TPA: hypothetical protein [Caudoviricetes sp.]
MHRTAMAWIRIATQRKCDAWMCSATEARSLDTR